MTELTNKDFKLITFDCYGTLVDWETGLQNSLQSIPGVTNQQLPELVREYVQIEAAIEQQTYQSYVSIQMQTLESLAKRFRFDVSAEQIGLLSRDIGNWPPFEDTVDSLKRLKSKYMLGILSNIDVNLFALTNKRLGVEFDLIITAEEVHSYKPSHAHFLRAIEQSGIAKDEILHVAQSIFHDAAPADELNFNFAWINRYKQKRPNDVPMLGEFADLKSLANTLLLP
ncbi:MAG: haloacid dehalogenase [Phycisphaerae bacterium]|nr:MAG: haloacid dehalogenase [Phycisphaerae bacterium]